MSRNQHRESTRRKQRREGADKESHLDDVTTSECSHRPPCPGCPRFGDLSLAHRGLIELEGLGRDVGLSGVRVVSGDPWQCRLRARLAIRGRLRSPKIGLFESGTHRVVHIPSCRVHHPLINQVASVVRRALVETAVPSYSEATQLGIARYLQVVIERRSQTAQVVLVANSADSESLAACFNSIRERLDGQLHSLWFNSNVGTGNAVLGGHWHLVQGNPAIIDNFGGADVHYPPGAFGQSNPHIAERIIDHVRFWIPPGARVTEFYAGVGAIGLSVLDRVSSMRLNELSPHSLEGLRIGLAALPPAERDKVSVIDGAAGAARSAGLDQDVVIADPPRKGLDIALLDQLCESPPQRFVYVSCGLDSFSRDAHRLIDSGVRLVDLAAFNLIPFTEHVETVAVFERS